MQPYSVKRNNYNENPKRQDTETPLFVSRFIYDIVTDKIKVNTIVDPSAGNGNLTLFFRENGCRIIEYENNPKKTRYQFSKGDFLETKAKSLIKPDLVLCNPPFNFGTGKQLGSETFLKKIIDLFGEKTRIILFAPMGFRLNQTKHGKRYRWLRDICPEISSIISLPLNTFDNTLFHIEILCFNIPELKPHYLIPARYLSTQINLFDKAS